MLRIVDKEEYIDTLKWLNDDEIDTTFKPELNERKNHVGFEFIKMEAEDGSNRLQAMASAEIYSTQKGNVALINTLFTMPEERGNHYGKIVLYHLMKHIEDNYDNIYSFMATTNNDGYKSFIENDFEGHAIGRSKKSFKVYKEINKGEC